MTRKLSSVSITHRKRIIISLDENGVPDGKTPSRHEIGKFYKETASEDITPINDMHVWKKK